jgi:hypothetical protein
MNYIDKIQMIQDLHQEYYLDVNWLRKQIGIKTPEELRIELIQSRKDKLKNIFDDI